MLCGGIRKMRKQHNEGGCDYVSGYTKTVNGKKQYVGPYFRRSRSRKSDDSEPQYVPNKLFNAIAGGVCLFLCGALGWSLITSAYESITSAKGKVEQVKEVADYITSAKQGTNGTYEFDIKKEIDLSAGDVQSILEKLSEYIESGTAISENVIVLDYSEVSSFKDYEKKVINKLSKYSGSVTFVLIGGGVWSSDEALEEYEKVKAIASDNLDYLDDTEFSRIRATVDLNYPQSGNLMITLTFLNE